MKIMLKAKPSLVTTRDYIYDLAEEHDLVHRRSKLDQLADAISAHFDDDVKFDKTECLILELERAKIITGRAATRLQMAYLRKQLA